MDETRVIDELGKIEEMVYTQSEIISMQNGVIDEQFRLLCRYMTQEELDRYPLLESMKSVSEMRTALDT